MDANKKDKPKKAEDVKSSMKTIPHHTSQGHTTGAPGSATNSAEPALRSATTDSSRSPKNSNDDLPTGGNIR